ncbi:MAG: PH domain-containing protein [Phycisphaerales bacterium]
MSAAIHRSCEWIYEGLWGVLVRWFRVPREAPTLPLRSGEQLQSMRPASGWLRYLKFQFWLALLLFDGIFLFLAIAACAGLMAAGVWFLVPGVVVAAMALIILPDVVAYAAIHLHYDTTWYVLSPRSLRIRRGAMIVREMTITFENVQNVTVQQGPLQRIFGIADVVVDTAGGGVSSKHEGAAFGHRGILAGLDNAAEVRDLILARVRRAAGAGLGDERHPPRPALPAGAAASAPAPRTAAAGPAWSREHLALLRDIRETLRTQRGAGG